MKKIVITLLISLIHHFVIGQNIEDGISISGYGGVSWNNSFNGHSSLEGEGAISFNKFYAGAYGGKFSLGDHVNPNDLKLWSVNYTYSGVMLGVNERLNNSVGLFAELRYSWGTIKSSFEENGNRLTSSHASYSSFNPRLGVSLKVLPVMQVRGFLEISASNDLRWIDLDLELSQFRSGLSIVFGWFE